MIFLDPDLEPPHTAPAPRNAKANSRKAGHDGRVPSARTLVRFLAQAQAAVRLRGQVSVLLTTDLAIRRLNRQFRGKNKATDVLSFPAGGPAAGEIAGDLAISVPTALKQAIEQGHPLATEVKVLMLHGLLHLAGYDHETDEGQMARRELLLRGRLGLPKGLIERTTHPLARESRRKDRPSPIDGSAQPTLAAERNGKDAARELRLKTRASQAASPSIPSSAQDGRKRRGLRRRRA